MKKTRVLFATVLCMSFLAFAGCGSNDTNTNNPTDGNVNQETTDMYDDNVNDGSMADDAEKAIDDVKDAVDGNKNSTKETTVNQ